VNGKATAFIGTLPEMFYAQFFLPADRPTSLLFSDRKRKRLYLIFVAAQTDLLPCQECYKNCVGPLICLSVGFGATKFLQSQRASATRSPPRPDEFTCHCV
jgi:hypothetical protein